MYVFLCVLFISAVKAKPNCEPGGQKITSHTFRLAHRGKLIVQQCFQIIMYIPLSVLVREDI